MGPHTPARRGCLGLRLTHEQSEAQTGEESQGLWCHSPSQGAQSSGRGGHSPRGVWRRDGEAEAGPAPAGRVGDSSGFGVSPAEATGARAGGAGRQGNPRPLLSGGEPRPAGPRAGVQHQAVSRAGGPSPQADCYPCSAGPTSVITAATAPVTTWGPGAGRRSDKQTQFPQTNPPPRRPGQTFCVHFPWRGRDSGRCCGELSSGPPPPPILPRRSQG